MTTEKEIDVLGVAMNAFIRYGFRRVTMGHIAQEAGMSRPALYLLFPNKEAIFRAVLQEFVDRICEDVQSGLDNYSTVADKLGFVLEIWTVRLFKLVHDSPDAKELTDCAHEFASDVVEDGRRRFETTLADILKPGADALSNHDLTPGQVARVLAVAADGFKQRARDSNELRELINCQINLIQASLAK